ncbi:molybdenum ABC transporter ATP-binding protein [Mucilaginibacter sp. PPCGB 2223]|uniref:sulfate/molybdate ABC transporter ATP-binding protein n=1 Tax=Mucilaginibacter sp. PPCGB 2223 TaxID=1886027 RepID=UPI00082611A3|nr:ATP-binding cassette domain-containing protein [Mucilaginibacter sp. PPCGB 2223]OCX53214.1 molybdenum ABC transporter ATP-binding protein [Mucilaginibacter sp. PPCGB 2223]
MIIIDIEKKLRAYEGHKLLKVNTEIAPNSITSVTGPSGAGKTTLLKMIAGLTTPEKGRIIVNNEIWLDAGTRINLSPQKRKTGFVFQGYALFPNMTVKQHLEYATTDQEWTNELLHFAKLETLANHKPEYLSGGQQQRLAIIRALAVKPQLMLMDEPFSALDMEMRQELIVQLKVLLQRFDTTCLIVTHNPYELEALTGNTIHIS